MKKIMAFIMSAVLFVSAVMVLQAAGDQNEEETKSMETASAGERFSLAAVAQDLEYQDENGSAVYFTSDITPEGLQAVYDALNWEPTGKVAVKLSTGEPPASNYLRPELIKDLVQSVEGTIVECNTAYGGSRSETAMHRQVAEDHGFTAIADVDILDEEGSMELPVEGGTQLESNLVGSHFGDYDSYLVLSHFKGHAMAGFGGSIKNISIGLGSQEGKCLIHTGGRSHTSPWGGDQTAFTESMAEAGKSVSDHLGNGDRIVYVNVLNNISIDCDCDGNPAAPDIHDIGILASADPVAIDQASIDLCFSAEGSESLQRRVQNQNGLHTLEHAQEIGLGNRNYNLIDINEEEAGADKVSLNAAITEAESTYPEENAEDYTEESWAAYQEALETAKAVAANENAGQSDIDEAEAALLDAIDGLTKIAEEPAPSVPVTTDKSELTAAIAAAEASYSEKHGDSYTTESWAAYQEALETAKTILADESAAQETVDQAVSGLEKAQGSLESKTDVKNLFGDVNDASWYKGNVQYVYDQKIMTGMRNDYFGAAENLARAQFARLLWNMEGQPKTAYRDEFLDVPDDDSLFYKDAVMWASSEGVGVITGYTRGVNQGKFGPGDDLNREQMATMMYRYAGYKGYDTEITITTTRFPDENMVNTYAKKAVLWAVEKGLITGDQGRLNPQGVTNRAVCATIIQRFLKNVQGAAPETPAPEQPESGDKKTLVAYFSATNHTEEVARYIAAATGGDLFELIPTDPYTSEDLDWTNADSRVSREHGDESLRVVELEDSTPDHWEDYDTVFIGYPIWWGNAAWPVDGFISANDFTGKTVIPFCTSSSSGLGESAALLKEAAGSGNWLDGQRFQSNVSEETVQEWVESLGL